MRPKRTKLCTVASGPGPHATACGAGSIEIWVAPADGEDMRLVRYAAPEGPYVGALVDDTVVDLHPGDVDLTMLGLYEGAFPRSAGRRNIADVDLLAPLIPGKIIATGLNYRDHCMETGLALPERPLMFAKYPSAVTGPYSPIEKLPETTQLDYEGELGVVIGRAGRDIPPSSALDHVAGYLVVNDVSARDAQFLDEQWVRGKSFDTFAPMGPALVLRTECPDASALDVRTWVNGELRQQSNTKNLVFDVAALIEYYSRYFTLNPGDIILTGTPGGVGLGLHPPQYLDVGDVVEVEVEQLGRIRNQVVQRS